MKTWLVTHTAGGTTWSFGYWLGTAWYQICTVTIPENGESAAGNSDYLEEKK